MDVAPALAAPTSERNPAPLLGMAWHCGSIKVKWECRAPVPAKDLISKASVGEGGRKPRGVNLEA